MKRALVLAVMSMGLAVPAFAQQSSPITEQQKQAIQAVNEKYIKAYDGKDAKGLAALYADDGMVVGSFEMVMGRQEIEKHVTDLIQQGQLGSDLAVEVDWKSVASLGNNLILGAGTWAATLPLPPVAQSTGQPTAAQGSSQQQSGSSAPPSQLNLKPGDRMHGSYTFLDEIRGNDVLIRSLSYNVGVAGPTK
ncbi:MAG: YybH family protein [Stellaceae bacterium]